MKFKTAIWKTLTELEKEQQDAIREIYPSRISEAEPKKGRRKIDYE
jgi:hypothetical protein